MADNLVEREVIIRAAICGQHHKDDCATCKVARDWTNGEMDVLRASIAHLRTALERSREGWENAIELGLIPERHANTARILVDEARAAIALLNGKPTLVPVRAGMGEPM